MISLKICSKTSVYGVGAITKGFCVCLRKNVQGYKEVLLFYVLVIVLKDMLQFVASETISSRKIRKDKSVQKLDRFELSLLSSEKRNLNSRHFFLKHRLKMPYIATRSISCSRICSKAMQIGQNQRHFGKVLKRIRIFKNLSKINQTSTGRSPDVFAQLYLEIFTP